MFEQFLQILKDYLGLFGVFIGATITFFVTQYFYERKSKDDVSFKLVDQYFEKFKEISVVKGLLETDQNYNYAIDEINQIKKLGGWYNFVKGLEDAKLISDEILGKMPLGAEIEEFEKLIVKKATDGRQDFTDMKNSWNFFESNEESKLLTNSIEEEQDNESERKSE